MKISVICIGRGSNVKSVDGKEVIVYHVDFVVKKEVNVHQQRHFGTFHVESFEPFHYKEKNEYTLMLSELITTAKESDMKKMGKQN